VTARTITRSADGEGNCVTARTITRSADGEGTPHSSASQSSEKLDMKFSLFSTLSLNAWDAARTCN